MAGRSGAHDEFFKAVLAQPGVADRLLRERLPPQVVARLGEGPPEDVTAEFIDPSLAASRADRIFRLPAGPGAEVWGYCILEHKSLPDRQVALQVLGYLTRAWERLARSGLRRLPIIVPLVVYHGRAPWPGPGRFSGLLAGDADLHRTTLDFPLTVLDVGAEPEAGLSSSPVLQGGLLALKYARRVREQPGNLARLARLVRGPDGLPLPEFLAYVLRAWWAVSPQVLERELEPIVTGKERIMLSQAARQWLAEGRQVGRQEGREEGREEGRLQSARALLLRVVQRRFGPVPASVEALVEAAGLGQLEAWVDQAVEAPSLDTLFPGHAH